MLGHCYIMKTSNGEQVVQVTGSGLHPDTVVVCPFTCSQSKSGRMHLRKEQVGDVGMEVRVADLDFSLGSFQIQGVPEHIAEHLRSQAAQVRAQMPAVPIKLEAPRTPAVITKREAPPVLKSKLAVRRADERTPPSVMTESRFRHASSLRKMKELGFQDSQALRDVLTQCNGHVATTLEYTHHFS